MRFRDAFGRAPSEQVLRREHAQLLGKKGELTALLGLMRHVPATIRPAIGEKVNAFRNSVETAFDARLVELAADARSAALQDRPFDLTLPGRTSLGRGHAQPSPHIRNT